jgi:hypothetical protein
MRSTVFFLGQYRFPNLLCEMARRNKIVGMSLTKDENSAFIRWKIKSPFTVFPFSTLLYRFVAPFLKYSVLNAKKAAVSNHSGFVGKIPFLKSPKLRFYTKFRRGRHNQPSMVTML